MQWWVWLAAGVLVTAIAAGVEAQGREEGRSVEELVKALMEINSRLEARVKALEERLSKRDDKTEVLKEGQEETRVKAIEERLDKLDRVEVIKQVKQYVCPSGEILESSPQGGRCPDGSLAEEQVTVKKFKFSRRESLSEKIEAAIAETEVKRVTVGGSARGIVQQPFYVTGSKVVGTGSVDLFMLSRPMAFSTIFVDFEAIGGSGPDELAGSRSRLNADAETLGPGVTDQVKVREAWLDLRLLERRLYLVGGLLDLTNYVDRNVVANDETTQFLNGALVNNPMLKQPLNGPGLAVRYEPDRDMAVAFGVQSPDRSGSNVANKVYGVAEFDYQLHLPQVGAGNYRVWGRYGRITDDRERVSWGVGVSLDQQIRSSLTIFARAGVGRTGGSPFLSHAWSMGLQWTAPFATRIRDRLGIAFSSQVESDGSESVGEAYYSLFFTDRLAVSADLQWLFSGPNGVSGKRNSNILVPGARVTVSF